MNNYKKTIQTIFAVISLTFLAKFLGFFRDSILGSQLGADMESDAYIMALNITSIVFVSFGSAIVTAAIPIIVRIITKKGKEEAFDFVNNLLNILIIIAFVAMGLGMLFSEQVVTLFASGFSGYKFLLTVKLTKIMFPILIFICITYTYVALMQSLDRFKITSIISLPANILTISFLCFLAKKYGVEGLAVVTLIGWMLQFLIMTPFLYQEGYGYRLRMQVKDPYIKEFFSVILLMAVVASMNQVNILIDEKQASFLGNGKISFLHYANTLYQAISSTTILGISAVMFPKFAQKAIEYEKAQYAKFILSIVKIMMFVLLPMTTGIVVLRETIIGLVFERGAFDREATIITAAVFACYALGMLSIGIMDVVNKAFYAVNNKKTPVYYALLIILLNVVFNQVIGKNLDVLGLALSTAIASSIGSIGLLRTFSKKMGYFNVKSLMTTFIKTMIGCMVMACTVYAVSYGMQFYLTSEGLVDKIIQACVCTGIGCVVYAFVTMKLKLQEAAILYDYFIKPLHKKCIKQFQK